MDHPVSILTRIVSKCVMKWTNKPTNNQQTHQKNTNHKTKTKNTNHQKTQNTNQLRFDESVASYQRSLQVYHKCASSIDVVIDTVEEAESAEMAAETGWGSQGKNVVRRRVLEADGARARNNLATVLDFFCYFFFSRFLSEQLFSFFFLLLILSWFLVV